MLADSQTNPSGGCNQVMLAADIMMLQQQQSVTCKHQCYAVNTKTCKHQNKHNLQIADQLTACWRLAKRIQVVCYGLVMLPADMLQQQSVTCKHQYNIKISMTFSLLHQLTVCWQLAK